jgi:transposase
VLLLCAAFLFCSFCSRSSVDHLIRRYRAEKLGCTVDAEGQLTAPVRTTVLFPWVKRSLGALLKAPPRAYGRCRTRWSGATLAIALKTNQGLAVSAWTVRRWLHELGWVGKRAKLVAEDDEPSASSAWLAFGIMSSRCKHGRCWSLPMESVQLKIDKKMA